MDCKSPIKEVHMRALNRAFAGVAILTAVGVGGTILSGNAWADRDGCHVRRCGCEGRESGWKGHGHRGHMLAKALGLSREQKEQIKTIFRKHHDEIAPLRAKMVSERRELRDLIRSDKPDETALREQWKKIAATGGDLAVLRARMSREVRTVLTTEQVKKFRDLQEKRDLRSDRMMHRGEGRHSNGE